MAKVFAIFLILAIAPLAINAQAMPKSTGRTKLVKVVDLQQFFHTKNPWQLKVYQEVAKFPHIAKQPLRACFVEFLPSGHKTTNCHPLKAGNKLDTIKLRKLPSATSGETRAAIVLHATWAGGLASFSGSGIYVWNYDARLHQFKRALKSSVSVGGAQELVQSGSLAGLFVSVDTVYEGDEPNMNTPTHYEISVYASAARGYVKVLSFLSAKRYPNFRSGKALSNPIQTLTPTISHQLHAVYPHGTPSLERK